MKIVSTAKTTMASCSQVVTQNTLKNDLSLPKRCLEHVPPCQCKAHDPSPLRQKNE
jgi:hypothetical protein